MSASPRRSIALAIGLLVGVSVALLALGMSGAGHGWSSARFSAVSVVAAPLAALAWSYHGRLAGFVLAIVVVIGAVGSDVLLWRETVSEGTYYVRKVWDAGPLWFVLWGVLFASWQLLAALVTLRGVRTRGAA